MNNLIIVALILSVLCAALSLIYTAFSYVQNKGFVKLGSILFLISLLTFIFTSFQVMDSLNSTPRYSKVVQEGNDKDYSIDVGDAPKNIPSSTSKTISEPNNQNNKKKLTIKEYFDEMDKSRIELQNFLNYYGEAGLNYINGSMSQKEAVSKIRMAGYGFDLNLYLVKDMILPDNNEIICLHKNFIRLGDEYVNLLQAGLYTAEAGRPLDADKLTDNQLMLHNKISEWDVEQRELKEKLLGGSQKKNSSISIESSSSKEVNNNTSGPNLNKNNDFPTDSMFDLDHPKDYTLYQGNKVISQYDSLEEAVKYAKTLNNSKIKIYSPTMLVWDNITCNVLTEDNKLIETFKSITEATSFIEEQRPQKLKIVDLYTRRVVYDTFPRECRTCDSPINNEY
ncbi:hypothetical protein QFZ81_000187 [Paenibacillus sp. V4I9]|uniref:hypothetical protein n=1 Tax=Paenibacillus sp. V4I9 TaxID=3042308 RepID=UPI002787AAB4|nr:hypothetical protein [Paenibacillus sp. V4I9]MDQ0885099.1 hypothetical protein [Paenibacillus sp. V4I9]